MAVSWGISTAAGCGSGITAIFEFAGTVASFAGAAAAADGIACDEVRAPVLDAVCQA